MRQIRPYDAADRDAISGVFYRAVHEGSAAFYTEAERAAWAPSPLASDRPDKLLDQWAWVAERDGVVTGFISLCPDGELDMLFVLPEVMGDGTAAQLYDTLLHQARAVGLARLTVRASDLSHRFLTRRGWALDGRERLEDAGEVFHLYLMSLNLTPLVAPE